MSTATHRLTIEDYIALDAASEVRNEFFRGKIFAMEGGSPNHADIKENLSVSIGLRLRETSCRGASSQLRVRIEASGFHTYPDYLIVCGEPRYAEDDPHSLLNPIAIVEVLSPSTEKHDRTFKLDQYRLIPSLTQYVLVSQDTPRVELFERTDEGWLYHSFTELEHELTLPSGVKLKVSEIYDRIEFPKPEPIDAPQPAPQD